MEKNKLGAVILAAGFSSRMRSFKPLLVINGTTAIERIITAFQRAEIENIIVVTGYNRSELIEAVEDDVCFVFNEKYEEGMFTSIKKGVQAAEEKKLDGIFLTLVDAPLISSKAIERMAKEKGDSFVVPTYLGKKGHPLYIPSKYFDEIIAYEGAGGLKGVTERFALQKVETGEIGCVMDMDTPEAYEEILEIADQEFDIFEELRHLSRGRRFYLIRHGEIRQHDGGKIFLGQTDPPLSEKGRKQAEKLSGYSPKKVYASNLTRAMETARIAFPHASIVEKTCFREMNLGTWDGRYIEEVRKEYPEEYERRGKDIFAFKTGSGMENFYDLEYRVLMGLRNILMEDPEKDIYIVAHSGVLRSIENGLNGRLVDAPWEKMKNGEVRMVAK